MIQYYKPVPEKGEEKKTWFCNKFRVPGLQINVSYLYLRLSFGQSDGYK